MRAAGLLLCLLATSAAGQEPPSAALLPAEAPIDPVRAALYTWHRGERVSGFGPFVGSGLATGVTGVLLGTQGGTLGRAAGWTLFGFGALELVAGLYFGLSAFGNEAARDALLTKDRAVFLETERARLTRITTRFQPILLGVEAAVTLGGGVLAGVGGLQRDDALLGVGLGLAVQGLVLFLLDWAVLDRAQAYAVSLGL